MSQVIELIDQSAHKHLSEEDIEQYEEFKIEFEEDDDDDPLGCRENVEKAICSGFFTDASKMGLSIAAEELGMHLPSGESSFLNSVSPIITSSSTTTVSTTFSDNY